MTAVVAQPWRGRRGGRRRSPRAGVLLCLLGCVALLATLLSRNFLSGQGFALARTGASRRGLSPLLPGHPAAERSPRSATTSERDEAPVSVGEVGTDATTSSLNLAKNLVGSGILSLPAGVAAFSSSSRALAPALLLLGIAACLSAYSFFTIGRACEETKTSTYEGAWSKSIGRGAWVPRLICLLECLGGSIIYAMVLGDVFSSLLQGLPLVPSILTARSSVIVALAIFALFPLCCLRSFGQLAKFSLLGTMATSYVVLFVTKRFFDGSYGPGGAYHSGMATAALSSSSTGLINTRMLILVSILATAFEVHFNVPRMYTELTPVGKDLSAADAARKQRRHAAVAAFGFGIATLQYALVMVFGFLTFGSGAQGNLLMNYASSDPWALAARVAIGVSTLFGYPMQFAGLRDGVAEALGLSSGGRTLSQREHRLLTAFLLAAAVAIACCFRDLGQFQAIEGAFLATFLIYVAPPAMALRLAAGPMAKAWFSALIALGVLLGVVGGFVTTMPSV
eukprot:TRINITY_DN22897_c0_g1_i1.p1 TRINITY_DN22897_c0_g1~~TRINITY_DN22897_c0_g1_i1.p1  ORF type:complete len:520 (-),score=85.92 TRINITY_DN22897_c0_g1_i1:35-1564(-)